jgi:hypothetical protein
MAKIKILCWQDIPSVVEASDGTSTHKEQLSLRFQELIDLIAMKKKLAGTDAYLEQWQKEPAPARDGTAKEAAQAVAREIEARYDEIRAASLAAATRSSGAA